MNVRFLVRVSYLEIYNEEVRDLLGKDQMQRLEVCTLCPLCHLFETSTVCIQFIAPVMVTVNFICQQCGLAVVRIQEMVHPGTENPQIIIGMSRAYLVPTVIFLC